MKSTLQHLMLLGGIILLSATMMSAQDATEATAAGLYNDALELIKAKKYEEGLPILEEALAKAEANGNQQVIDLSKKNGAMAAYNLGNKKRKAKAYDEASALYSKGMEMNPGYSSNYIGMGRLLAAKGNQEEALAKYFEGAKIAKAEAKPKKEKEAYERAKSLISSNYKEDKYDKVITLGDAYVAEKKNADVSYYIAKSLMATNKNEAAVPYLDDALSQSPEKKDKFIYAKGQALEAAGKNAEAVAAYKLITDAKYKESAQYKVKTLK
jgi:tetratricopeptide (TPR) repeat protein